MPSANPPCDFHIGGAKPSRPTEMAAASSVPSSFFCAAAMKVLAPPY
jgi:hypothetical protein